MDLVLCPHCKTHRIVTSRVPKEVVVVMPCPNCHELVIVFRQKAIALDRRIIEQGTMDERKSHLADIIAEFLEPGLFPFDIVDPEALAVEDFDAAGMEQPSDVGTEEERPITQLEVDRFVKIDLKRIDDSTYFRKHFN